MSQAVEGTWIRTGGYGRFRVEQVKGMWRLAMSGRHMWYKQYFSKKFKVSCLKQGSDTNDLCPRNWANDLPMRRPTLHQLKQCILGRNHIASTPFAAIAILCRSPYITLELGLGRVELVHFGFKASFLSETKYKQDNFNFAKWRLNDRFSVLLMQKFQLRKENTTNLHCVLTSLTNLIIAGFLIIDINDLQKEVQRCSNRGIA